MGPAIRGSRPTTLARGLNAGVVFGLELMADEALVSEPSRSTLTQSICSGNYQPSPAEVHARWPPAGRPRGRTRHKDGTPVGHSLVARATVVGHKEICCCLAGPWGRGLTKECTLRASMHTLLTWSKSEGRRGPSPHTS